MTISSVFLIACVVLWIASAAFTIWYTINWLYQALFPPEEKTEDDVEEK